MSGRSPGESITLGEVREYKSEAEKKIEEILNEFQEYTGCPVDGIYFSRLDCTPLGHPDQVGYLKLKVRVEEGL